jgi:hypothetical protein
MFKVNLPKSILENNESDKVENNNYKKFVGIRFQQYRTPPSFIGFYG